MLAVRDLFFAYRGWRRTSVAIDGLDWTLGPGKVTMLLGPNGSGKSTLLKILAGHLRPQQGQVLIDGEPARTDDLAKRVGWMPQDIQPARGLRVIEQIEYVGWLSGKSHSQSRAEAATVIEQVGLAEKARVRSTDLSGGQLRRVGLAQAIMQGGSALLLDEPTAGLDPAQALAFRDLLSEVDCPGGILVSTHQAGDLLDRVDDVVVISGGQLRFTGTIKDFTGLVEEGVSDVMAKAYQAVLEDIRA